jgi:hypothetical protein
MRWSEREDDKAHSDQAHSYESEVRTAASDDPYIVEVVFQEIGYRRGNKENGNIDPVG